MSAEVISCQENYDRDKQRGALEEGERGRRSWFSSKNGNRKEEETITVIDEVILELKTYKNPNKLDRAKTFLITLITSSLGGWDVFKDFWLGITFLLVLQHPAFGILTLLLIFLPGLKFYAYRTKFNGNKNKIAWIFACLFFPLTFIISKVGLFFHY